MSTAPSTLRGSVTTETQICLGLQSGVLVRPVRRDFQVVPTGSLRRYEHLGRSGWIAPPTLTESFDTIDEAIRLRTLHSIPRIQGLLFSCGTGFGKHSISSIQNSILGVAWSKIDPSGTPTIFKANREALRDLQGLLKPS